MAHSANQLEWLTMNQSAYLKRFYSIIGAGACVLLGLVWVFIKGGFSPRGFGVTVLIWWIAMFAMLFTLIRSRQRSAEETRRKQIANGVPAEAVDRDQCVRNIRSMKKLIGVFAVLLVYGLLSTQGDPLMPRAIGAAVDVFFLAAFLHSILRSQKRLKELPANPATAPTTVSSNTN